MQSTDSEAIKEKNKQSMEELLAMPYNTMGTVGEGVTIIRVPGGWIYKFVEGIGVSSTFVPNLKKEAI